jgi:hypothetical protein
MSIRSYNCSMRLPSTLRSYNCSTRLPSTLRRYNSGNRFSISFLGYITQVRGFLSPSVFVSPRINLGPLETHKICRESNSDTQSPYAAAIRTGTKDEIAFLNVYMHDKTQ